MLCRVEMPTNEHIFGRFYRYQMIRGSDSASSRMNLIILPVILILAAIFMVVAAGNWLFPVIVLALTGAYLGYMLYLRPNSLFHKKAGIALQTEVYIFTENGFTRSVRSEEGGMPDNTSGRYDGLLAAVETKNDFYLYTGRTQAYLVGKGEFTNGTTEKLRAMLQKTMEDKFKTKQE
mgnify:CR=1 FL=1